MSIKSIPEIVSFIVFTMGKNDNVIYFFETSFGGVK